MNIFTKLLLVVAFVTCSFYTYSQCLLRPVDLSERIDNASMIAEGRVISRKSYWNAQHNLIHTAYTIEVYKIFRGNPVTTQVEIITEGGLVGNEMHLLEPNLEMIIGDVGIFLLEPTLYAKDKESSIPASSTFRAYALSQGFIKYNEKEKTAADVFNKYQNITTELYKLIEQRTGRNFQTIKQYSIDQVNQRSGNSMAAPVITNISPTTISAGTKSILTITGTDFGASMGSSTIEFKNADDGGATLYTTPSTEIISWSDTQIELNVPTKAGTGQVQVSIPGGGGGIAISAQILTVTFANLNASSSGLWVTRFADDNGSGGYSWSYNIGFNADIPAKDAFERALLSWRCGTLVNWQVGNTTFVNTHARDGTNIVRYDVGTELPAGVLGQCGSYWSGCATSNWFVDELDIRFNDGTNWYFGSGSPGGSQSDFESVALHELGHGHQLGHVINPGAVMHYAISAGTFNRVLSANDLAGGDVIMNRSTSGSVCGETVMTALNMSECGLSAIGDYRSKQTGNWDVPGNWERWNGTAWETAVSAPASTDGVITIRNGHTITVSTSTNADQLVVDVGGNLTLASTLTIDDGTGTDLTINGTFNFNSGTLTGAGTSVINASGIFNLATAGAKVFGTGLTNNGTLNWQDGGISQTADLTIINGSVFNISSSTTWDDTGFIGSINNTGTLSKSGAGTAILAIATLSNNGTVNLDAGTFQINGTIITNNANFTFNGGSFSSAGTFTHTNSSVVSGTGSFFNNGSLTLNATLNVPSTIVFTVGTSSFIAGSGNLMLNNDFTFDGSINGTGTFVVAGNLTWVGGSIGRNFTNAAGNSMNISTASPKTLGAVTITNNNILNWNDGNITFNSGAVLNNTTTFNISGNNTLSNVTGNGTLTNSGTITKSSTGTTTIGTATVNNNNGATIMGVGTIVQTGATFNNNGIIAPGLSPGILIYNTAQPFSSNSTLTIEIEGAGGPGQLTGHDQLQRAGNLTLNGNLTVIAGGAVPEGNYTIIDLTSGTLSGTFSSTNLPAGYIVLYFTDSVVIRKVCVPDVSIGASPGSTVCAGTNVTFTATPANGGTPTYQWQVNGVNVGANSDTYQSSALVNGDNVRCIMTSSLDCATPTMDTSNVITMSVTSTVVPAVSIAASPGINVCAGTNVTFTATPTNGGSTPVYQWKLNGADVGTNSNTYSIASLVNGDVVSCVMTSSFPCASPATTNSNNITMTVNAVLTPSVSISANPGNTICAGTGVTFTATPTNGGSTPSYQWKLNGNDVGTNSAVYTSTSLVNGDMVTCVMTSSYACPSPATVTSTAITMTVNPLIVPSVSISASPGTTICEGISVTFTATPVNGGTTPAYQWKLNGANVGTNSTIYTNASLANGDMVTCELTSNALCATPSTVSSNTITMTVNPILTPTVSIAASPGSTICAGTNVTFTATPTNGGNSPSYQWKLNGGNVGTNSATYSNASLINGDMIECVMTTSYACLSVATATSDTITMTVTGVVVPSVSIDANPGSSVCAGTNVTFTAIPTNGGSTPSYQWKLNGNDVGTNSATYSNASLVSGDVVSCVMTSSFPCAIPTTANSNNITMTVNPVLAPSVSIAASPGNTICEGTNVNFTATPANGGATPSYQWKINGNNIGSNSATYSSTVLANGDVITCVLTPSIPCPVPATATSNAITMTVNAVLTPTVSISVNTGNTICAGTNVIFTATPTNGGTTPSYQWKLNGNNVGTNSATYSNASLANGDMVTCVLTSSYVCPSIPAATSNTITMTVNAVLTPSVSIAANPGSTICAGTGVTFTATPANGGANPSYQWKVNGNNVGTNSTTYTNPSFANGDVVTCEMTSSYVCPNPATATSNSVTMTVNPILSPSVSIAASPGNTVCASTNITFTATPTNGGGTPSYQWKLNGTNVGANSATYSNATLVSGDMIECVMTTSYACPTVNTATSNTITMTVTGVVVPSVSIAANPGNTICAGTNITFTAIPTNGGNTPSYQWKLNGNDVGTNSATYSNASLVNGDVVTCIMTSSFPCAVPASATSNAITMSVSANVTPSVSIAANPGNTICTGTSVTFTATPTNGGALPTYQWKLNGTNVGINSITYTNATLANNDVVTCEMTSSVTCVITPTVSSNTIMMTVNPVLTPSVSINASPGSTVCAGTNVTFTAIPVNGGSAPAYQWMLNGNNVGTSSATYSNASIANGDIVSVVMTTSYVCPSVPTATSNTIIMTVNPLLIPAVSIAANPGNVICPGTSVTFTATPINGGSTPSYQWKLNGNNVGINSTTYTNASLANGDVVSCVMTSSETCASPSTGTSNSITMTVNAVPSISVHPASQSVVVGSNVTFSVTASGTGLTYQWRKGGIDIPGATGSSYTITGVALSDAGNYDVVITGTCPPAVTSNTAVLTVSTVSITTQPSNRTVCVGGNTSFSIVASGASLTYQWQVSTGGGPFTNIPGATASTLSLNAVTLSMNGNQYRCVVSGILNSNAATLTVNPLPVVTLNLPVDTIYMNTPQFSMSGGSPAGGTYSGTGISGGNFNPANNPLGNYTVTYTYNDGNGCTNTAIDVFTVLPATELVNIYPNPVVNGNATLIVSQSLVGGTATVYNESGQKVDSWVIAGRRTTYNFKWATGHYAIIFRKGSVKETKQIIITR